MVDTPLRAFLKAAGETAEAFAIRNGLSAWSVRHWARGDKTPNRDSQEALSRATAGAVSHRDWLEWALAKAASPVIKEAA